MKPQRHDRYETLNALRRRWQPGGLRAARGLERDESSTCVREYGNHCPAVSVPRDDTRNAGHLRASFVRPAFSFNWLDAMIQRAEPSGHVEAMRPTSTVAGG